MNPNFAIQLSSFNFQEVDPKVLNARIPGEWEPQQSVLIQWFMTQTAEVGPDVPTTVAAQTNIIKLLTKNQKGSSPFIIQINFPRGDIEEAQKIARTSLKNVGVEVDEVKIKFTSIPCYMDYPRDFGSEMLLDTTGSLVLINIQFRNYALFNLFTDSATLGTDPLGFEQIQQFRASQSQFSDVTQQVSTTLISEGGDREFNGQGTLMTIEDTEVGKRYLGRSWPELLRFYGNTPNGIATAKSVWSKAKNQVENELKRVFNLKHIIWIPRSIPEDENFIKPEDNIAWLEPGEVIDFTTAKCVLPKGHYVIASANGHIDEFARFVAPHHVLLNEITEDEALENNFLKLGREVLENTANVIKKYSDKNKLNIQITRIPAPTLFWYEMNTDMSNSPYYMNQFWHEFIAQSHGKFIDNSRSPIPSIFQGLPALSYANFLITNEVVIGQMYGDLPAELLGGSKAKKAIREKDAKAKAVLQSIFPDRLVEMVSAISINLGGGGIHCNTRNVPAAETGMIQKINE